MNLERWPLVSVIMPVYNAVQYIDESVNSILNQSWNNIQLIIVNDGSTDGTKERLINLAKLDSRILLVHQDNKGCSNAKNVGLKFVRGEYLQYLDADDILSLNKIESQVLDLEKKENYISISRTFLFTKIPVKDLSFEVDGNFVISSDDPLEFLLNLYRFGGMIQPNAFLLPQSIFKEIGPWNTDISPATDEDSEYFCRAILKSSGIIPSPESYNFYRTDASITSLSRIRNRIYMEGTLRTIDKRAEHLLNFENSERVKQSIGHLYARFMYGNYHIYPDLVSIAEQRIFALGLKRIPLEGGNSFRRIAKIIGMKNALLLKRVFKVKPKF